MTVQNSQDGADEHQPADREDAILSLVPTACRIARHRARLWGLSADDAVGDAMVGAVQAVDRYDADRGVELTSFAYRRIVGAIVDGARERSWPSRRGGADVPVPVVVPLEELSRDGSGASASEPECPYAQATLDRVEDAMVAEHLIAQLPRRHAWVVREHFLRSRPLKDIATDLRVSESRVCQIVGSAKRTMRASARRQAVVPAAGAA
jgi:RNA polymerase sigma factor (sigma-70 family)